MSSIYTVLATCLAGGRYAQADKETTRPCFTQYILLDAALRAAVEVEYHRFHLLSCILHWCKHLPRGIVVGFLYLIFLLASSRFFPLHTHFQAQKQNEALLHFRPEAI